MGRKQDTRCDLLKISYLCKVNNTRLQEEWLEDDVVIC